MSYILHIPGTKITEDTAVPQGLDLDNFLSKIMKNLPRIKYRMGYCIGRLENDGWTETLRNNDGSPLGTENRWKAGKRAEPLPTLIFPTPEKAKASAEAMKSQGIVGAFYREYAYETTKKMNLPIFESSERIFV